MNNESAENISRRQLFGGARRPRPTTMGQGGRGSQFQPEETLTPSPGLTLDELPPVHQATLTAADIRSLFRDLTNHATEIRLSSAGRGKPSRPEELSQAEELLLAGGIKRLQIRYSWQEKLWIDTLDQTEGGFRVVRIAHHPGNPGAQV